MLLFGNFLLDWLTMFIYAFSEVVFLVGSFIYLILFDVRNLSGCTHYTSILETFAAFVWFLDFVQSWVSTISNFIMNAVCFCDSKLVCILWTSLGEKILWIWLRCIWMYKYIILEKMFINNKITINSWSVDLWCCSAECTYL